MSTPLSPEAHTELSRLIQSLHDERISSEDLARLENWVCDSEAARELYLEYMNL